MTIRSVLVTLDMSVGNVGSLISELNKIIK